MKYCTDRRDEVDLLLANKITQLLGSLQQFCILPIFGVLVYGVSTASVLLFMGMYLTFAFGVTVGYHRYFSHRSFQTSRVF